MSNSPTQQAIQQSNRLNQLVSNSAIEQAIQQANRMNQLVSDSAIEQAMQQSSRINQLVSNSAIEQAIQQSNRINQLMKNSATEQVFQQANRMKRLMSNSATEQAIQQANRLRNLTTNSSTAQILEQTNRIHEILRDSVTEHMRHLTSSIESSAIQQLLNQSIAHQKLVQSLNGLKPTDIKLSDISLSEGDFTVHGSPVDLSSAEELLLETANQSSDITDLLRRLVDRVKEFTASDELRALICVLILPYLISVWAPIHLNPWSADDRRKLVNDITQEIKMTHDHTEIKDYRYAIAKSGLFMRSDSNKQSEIVGGLPFGSPAKLLEKSKNNDWSLVENEDGDIGWVFSRYLRKFK